MIIRIEIEVDNQMIIDQIITAIEGGSNYWLTFKREEILNARPQNLGNEAFSEYIGHLVVMDKHSLYIPVFDAENPDDCLGSLSMSQIKSGLQKLAKDYPDRLQEIVDGTGDAETADIFMQYAILGEIVYG